MQISITFKAMNSSEALKSHIHEKFEKLDKMLDSEADAHIVLSVEKLRHIADINMTCDKIKIYAKEESENNMYSSIDALSERLNCRSESSKTNNGGIFQEIRKALKPTAWMMKRLLFDSSLPGENI